MINKQFKSSENSSGTALNYNEEAPEMLWSSKTEDGYLGKCRKHCTYVSLPPSPEQLSAKKGFLGIISLHREKRKSLASLIHRQCLQPLLWGPPVFTNTKPSWQRFPEFPLPHPLPKAAAKIYWVLNTCCITSILTTIFWDSLLQMT